MLSDFPRYPLTFGPTPIEHLSRLTKHLGGAVEIYAKREDCNSGLAFGGNKLRKLEYIVPDAIASNADTLVSIGGVQSNHTRMVAAVAAKLGMKCVLIQESWVPHEDAVYDRVGNIMLSRIMGAETRMVDAGFDIGIRESWQAALDDVRAKGGKPYAIPAGASVHKLGGLGYVGFAEEVRAQEAAHGPALRLYRRVHCHRLDACRHGGGLRRRRSRTQRHRHRCILHPGADQGAGARHRAQHVCPGRRERHRGGRHRPARGLRLSGLRRAVEGDAGGHPPDARLEGMITDPVYEGKSMQGMIDLIRKGFFPTGSKVLYAHLGGGPALNGYSYTFRNG